VFETLIRDELENTYGTICTSDETVIASMIVVMESLMEAQRHINEEGYITQYAAGVGTTGWVKLRNECIDKIIKMLGELGLVARGRPKKVNKPTEVDELFAHA
jgi:phage terminase small subunit